MSDADPLWYKDAIIYQLHIKAFFDSNDDGIGDFQGLTQKLDYLQDLGVTALWQLPFYPSPLRDDGYDIADYNGVNPSYGTMADFRHFVREAHSRGLKVITELVVNHTSDQHPWFQRARQAKKGSSHRNYYVWSDTDKKYQGTRIIFLDTEKSNWTWDAVAKQYYWHRFYSHQPDLNYDNPAVVKAVINVMKLWLDLGVDGLRLDAVPYLCEREGTNNENLPESHDILKRLRAEVDKHYSARMLLAEANQWPEDVLPYFGDGDECHMAFHFPLMPRLYMAVAQEDRHPITDIMRQTPDIPANCQWAIFLRNHDELTLEMVTDRERDYLWNFYASDPRARINLGIRRRLAPLMENDRRRIDLLNSLLMSMPGTPVLYYGDEIGMGDNVYLGDRDGVRTPMQWSLDRNGGFSRSDPARLFLPANQDAVYGYQAVNVEAQSRSSTSMLNTARRMIAVRRGARAFGRGELRFLYPTNRKVLCYVRSYENEIILCVCNLSRAAQSVELDLADFRGRVPVELIGRSYFPVVADRPYHLTLQAHSFFWFALLDPTQMEDRPAPPSESVALPEFVTVVVPHGWDDVVRGHEAQVLTREVLPAFLPNQRWFGAKDRKIIATRIAASADLLPAEPDGPNRDGWCFMLVEASFADGGKQRYQLALGLAWEPPTSEFRIGVLSQTLAQVRRTRAEGVLYDVTGQEAPALAIIHAIKEQKVLSVRGGGTVKFVPTSAFERRPIPDVPRARRLGGEQSNSSILIEGYAVLKLYRAIHDGTNPEVEMTRFLTEETDFTATAPLLGTIEYTGEDGFGAALGVVTGLLENQGDVWSSVLDYLKRTFEDSRLAMTQPGEGTGRDEDVHAYFMTLAHKLGQRTAEMHRALCPIDTVNPDFKPEPITQKDLASWSEAAQAEAETALASLERWLDTKTGTDEATEALVRQLLALKPRIIERIAKTVTAKIKAMKTRYHGDYHMGQVLFVQNDFAIIDFEGEPRRPMAERRGKHSPLKDVAGMLRSVDYAAGAATRAASDLSTADREAQARFCGDWRDRTIVAFMRGYRARIKACPSWPEKEAEAQQLIDLFLLEKGFYEISYELANRPTWLAIPVQGVLDLMQREVR
jgi:maltose alpha-D-glucosyltransferase/alpha-amylase